MLQQLKDADEFFSLLSPRLIFVLKNKNIYDTIKHKVWKGDIFMKKIVYIEGMMCEGCAKTMKEAFEKMIGVESCKINLKNKCATLKLEGNIIDTALTDCVERAGFKPIEVKVKKGLF